MVSPSTLVDDTLQICLSPRENESGIKSLSFSLVLKHITSVLFLSQLTFNLHLLVQVSKHFSTRFSLSTQLGEVSAEI